MQMFRWSIRHATRKEPWATSHQSPVTITIHLLPATSHQHHPYASSTCIIHHPPTTNHHATSTIHHAQSTMYHQHCSCWEDEGLPPADSGPLQSSRLISKLLPTPYLCTHPDIPMKATDIFDPGLQCGMVRAMGVCICVAYIAVRAGRLYSYENT